MGKRSSGGRGTSRGTTHEKDIVVSFDLKREKYGSRKRAGEVRAGFDGENRGDGSAEIGRPMRGRFFIFSFTTGGSERGNLSTHHGH